MLLRLLCESDARRQRQKYANAMQEFTIAFAFVLCLPWLAHGVVHRLLASLPLCRTDGSFRKTTSRPPKSDTLSSPRWAWQVSSREASATHRFALLQPHLCRRVVIVDKWCIRDRHGGGEPNENARQRVKKESTPLPVSRLYERLGQLHCCLCRGPGGGSFVLVFFQNFPVTG